MSDLHFHAPISEQIWDAKYRLRDENKNPLEADVTQTWRRIAKALAEAEKPADQPMYEAMFYNALSGFKFLPAGRITAGAGTGRNVTLFNCLSSETAILTAEYGLVPIGEVAGETVHVIDGNGQWVEAPINSFGDQPVASVVLAGGYNGQMKKTIRATAGHRWILEDGTEATTNQLQGGTNLLTVKRDDVDCSSENYNRGVVHGLVFGDGSFERTDSEGSNTFRIRLCGAKAELISFFKDKHVSVTYPPSFDGDPLVRITGVRINLKELPSEGIGIEYLTGFLRGWFAADGAVCKRDHRPILSCRKAGVDWLRQFGAVAGMEVAYATRLSDETNYGKRGQPIFNVSFHRWTITSDDLLRQKHRKAFGVRPDYPWVVESIGPYGDPEPVFCPRVVTTASVQLDLGIHTGQCFVMGTVPDSMGGIFDMLKEAALTMQQGGGIGYDFSTLRPKGSLVKGVAADASGPLMFMDCWDAMCRTVMSAGSRRGAMMATMRCDHPDIELFIDAKRDPLKLRMFNLSVLVTDDFMAAVKADADWRLHFENRAGETLAEKTIKASDLWNKIMRSTFGYAEPGIIFIDRINAANNLNYMEEIAATNPCGEQPLPPYGACLLGSINLPTLIHDAFQPNAGMDRVELENLVAVAIRMMDNVVDVSKFPLPQQEAEAKLKRRLGLGVTGLADALIMCGLTYGSPEAVAKTELWMALIDNAAYRASIKLAEEKGTFPGFDVDGILAEGTHASTQPRDVTDGIRKHGLRNSHVTSIAPTGTISLYAGNVSSGVEPVFAYSYTRKVLNDDGTKREESVEDFAYREYRKHWEANIDPMKGEGEGWHDSYLPPYFVSAQTLEPLAHVRMQAAAQKHVDSSISKTINCPVDISFEDFCEVYMAAWDAGCKGCTTYRPNDVTGSILSVTEAPAKAAEPVALLVDSNPPAEGDWAAAMASTGRIPHLFPGTDLKIVPEPLMDRAEELDGQTYKLKWPGSDHALYITINDIEENGKLRPFEVFINSKNMEHFAWTVALTRMMSAVFRRGHDSTFVVEELKAVFDPKGGAWMGGKFVPSILAAIGNVVEKHMIGIGYIARPAMQDDGGHEIEVPNAPNGKVVEPRRVAMNPLLAAPYGLQPVPPMCGACHSSNVKKEAGCFVCKDCGNSNCG